MSLRLGDLSALRQAGCAWVTGASSGIGAAVSRRLIQDGWVVAGSARNSAKLDAIKAELGGQFYACPLDITHDTSLITNFEKVEAAHGPVTLAILNAGIYETGASEVFDHEATTKIFETNVLGTINSLGLVVKKMIARRGGQIAVMSSLAGYRGLPYSAGYCASRAATLVLAESLREHCHAHGVKLQVITPGFVDTPMTAKNTFQMPFLITPEVAANRIVDGLDGGRFEITFPKRLSILMKILRVLPYWIYFPLMRYLIRPPAA